MNLELKLETAQPNTRLDQALLKNLRTRYPLLSHQTLKHYFNLGLVVISGRPARSSQLLTTGNQYEVWLHNFNEDTALNQSTAKPAPQGCFLPVIYEDEDILALNKEAGCPSVPHSPNETRSAVNAAIAHYPGLQTVGYGGLEGGILHRLDTSTSGIILFAKYDAEFDRIKSLWKSDQIKKYYRAIITNQSITKATDLPDTINFTLAHSSKSKKRMVALHPSQSHLHRPNPAIRGRPLSALTKIIGAHKLSGRHFPNHSLDIEIQILTGVMHQIRLHLSAIGCPILGDRLYGGARSERVWLHAWKLQLPLRSNQNLTIQSALPKDWA